MREKFETQIDSDILTALRALAREEGRQLFLLRFITDKESINL